MMVPYQIDAHVFLAQQLLQPDYNYVDNLAGDCLAGNTCAFTNFHNMTINTNVFCTTYE